MLRLKQLVPTVALTLATAALIAPAAQARPADVSTGPSAQSRAGMPHWGTGTFGRDVTAGEARPQSSPLKNQLSIPADAQTTSLSVAATGGGFNWAAAAIGAVAASLLGLALVVGRNLRTRRIGQLAG